MKNEVKIEEVKTSYTSRRSFLRISGLTAVTAGLVLAGCNNDDDTMPMAADDGLPGVRNGIFDLGSGDLGVLTYAYALEQLEADFYTRVVNASNFNSGSLSIEERLVLTDLYQHEVIHREFFRTAITGALTAAGKDVSMHLLPNLTFDYGGLNFNDRTTVLNTAKALEDTGVSAYNGAGRLISDVNYLLIAGKIVSIEARHAAAIRSLINPGTNAFAGDDVVTTDFGLDVASDPSAVLNIAGGFISTEFTAKFLP